jgi:hypothetical protein
MNWPKDSVYTENSNSANFDDWGLGELQSRGLVHFSADRHCHLAGLTTENMDLTPFAFDFAVVLDWGLSPSVARCLAGPWMGTTA